MTQRWNGQAMTSRPVPQLDGPEAFAAARARQLRGKPSRRPTLDSLERQGYRHEPGAIVRSMGAAIQREGARR